MMKSMINIQLNLLMMSTFITLLINLVSSYNKFTHPVFLGLILLILCGLSALNIEIFNSFNWISYLMYLIIIGGLMIIFLYFTSFISNMKMSIKLSFIYMIFIKMMLFFIFSFLVYKNLMMFYPWYFLNLEISSLINQINLKISTMYMYMYNKNFSLIFCMIYLLISLTFIVKICVNKKLALRKIN